MLEHKNKMIFLFFWMNILIGFYRSALCLSEVSDFNRGYLRQFLKRLVNCIKLFFRCLCIQIFASEKSCGDKVKKINDT